MAQQIFTTLAVLAVVGLTPSYVTAATVCAEILYWDSRTPKNAGTGSRLVGPSDNEPAGSIEGQIYDMDGNCVDWGSNCGETDDDYLTDFTATASGTFCESVSDYEDVYFVATFESTLGRVLESDGNAAYIASNMLEQDVTGTVFLDWNLTCPEDAIYYQDGTLFYTINDVEGHCDSQSDVDTYSAFEEPRAAILGTIQQVDDNFGLNGYHGYTNPVTAYYPDTPTFNCTAGHAWGRNTFCMASLGWARAASATGHELGHLVHARALADYGTGEGYSWYSPLTGSCTGSWTNDVSEKCAVREGWASFVGAAALWEDSSPNPLWSNSNRILEGDDDIGNGGANQACIYLLNDPELRAGNVTRFYWDLYDDTTTGDDGADNANWTPAFITSQWEEFPYGTGNRDAAESGDEGVNAWDYEHRESGSQSELEQNCLDDQDMF